MRPDDRIRLQHMVEAAREAMSFAEGRTRSDLNTDRVLTMALVKEIEIIGEAAYQMEDETRFAITTIPWHAVINMRHRLVHVYYDINMTVLWKTLKEDLPPLISALEALLASKD